MGPQHHISRGWASASGMPVLHHSVVLLGTVESNGEVNVGVEEGRERKCAR